MAEGREISRGNAESNIASRIAKDGGSLASVVSAVYRDPSSFFGAKRSLFLQFDYLPGNELMRQTPDRMNEIGKRERERVFLSPVQLYHEDLDAQV